MVKCNLKDCQNSGTFRCGSCKTTYYCSKEHQKEDWIVHKGLCDSKKEAAVITSDNVTVPSSSSDTNKAAENTTNTSAATEQRSCRCMFCGDNLLLSSEEAAVDHMRVCPALQEQLSSKEAIHVPEKIKKKLHMT